MKMKSMTTLRLDAEDPNASAAITTATDALEGKDGPRLSVTLGGERLPAELVATLVKALRRLRETGGAIEVIAGTAELRDELALHGLDRVFAFPLKPESDRRPPRRWGALGATARIGAAVVLALLLCGTPPAPAQDEIPVDPAVILARVNERNPSLSSYQGRLHVQVRMVSFPYVRERLEGSTYFKRPANYEVVFDHVPWYAHGFDKLYSDVGDAANWERRFVVSYEGLRRYEGRTDVVLRLVQRVRGMIDHETVLIDPGAWTIDQIRYDYYNGGAITMTQHFRDVGGYQLLAGQHADIAIPHVRAVATASYDGYRTNVAIDDAVFRKGDGQ
jgi:hypothetical protein